MKKINLVFLIPRMSRHYCYHFWDRRYAKTTDKPCYAKGEKYCCEEHKEYEKDYKDCDFHLTCYHKYKSGKRKGQVCGKKFCRLHESWKLFTTN